MNRLTESLARFVNASGMAQVPAAAAQIIRTGVVDTIGTMLAGRKEPVVEIVRRHVAARRSGAAESSVLLHEGRAFAADAALINATAAHALDYDDVALSGHPSTVLVPALLAEAEALGASGADLIRAYLAGYEVWAELIGRDADSHHLKGWHPTAVLGTVGGAAAIACLRKLDVDTCRNALGIAASMAGGLVANFGSMTKPFHAGRAASSAIEAVRLAMLGMSASADAIEHHAGFLAAISPAGRVDKDRPADTLGQTLRILDSGLSIKKYPICYATHRVIDAVIDCAKRENIGAEKVSSVHAYIGVAQASMLRNHAPTTGLEAKFSLEFAVASALVARAVGLAQLTDEFVKNAQVRDLMKKVSISTTERLCTVDPSFAFSDRVEIRLADGRTIDSGEIRFARGNAKLPLTEADLRTKFLDCLNGVPQVNASVLYEQLSRLEDVRNLRTLAGPAPA
ncbi:MAG TPA: MmgE/PrpD family protein [Burkholderiales bacterium]